jgi:hypothetical protein
LPTNPRPAQPQLPARHGGAVSRQDRPPAPLPLSPGPGRAFVPDLVQKLVEALGDMVRSDPEVDITQDAQVPGQFLRSRIYTVVLRHQVLTVVH